MKVKYNRPMTIAAGFCCMDGVLLGTDTLVTDGCTKTYENKVFECSQFGSYPLVLMAGAGVFPRIKEFADRLLTENTFTDSDTGEDVKHALRKAIDSAWYRESVRMTNESGYNLDFIFAIKDLEGGTSLLHLCNADLYPIHQYCCVGNGAPIAKYLAAWLYSQSLPVEMFAILAMHIFREAKEYSDGCGGETRLQPLFNGFDDVDRPHIDTQDTAFLWGLYAHLKPLIYACINTKAPDPIFDNHVYRFEHYVRSLHSKAKSGYLPDNSL
jgi:20S proteasome alpha/beta subunit